MCQDCREGERIRKERADAIAAGVEPPPLLETQDVYSNPHAYATCLRCGEQWLWCQCHQDQR